MKVQIILLMCLAVCGSLTIPSWLAALEGLLEAGGAFSSAVDEFKKWSEEDTGTILLTIENYSKDTGLLDMQYHTFSGSVNQVNFDVVGGEKQAVAATGSSFRKTEGLIGWNVGTYDGMMAVVYWLVRAEINFASDSNKLGLGFVEISRLSDIAPSGSDVSIPQIGMRDFTTDGAVVQCCYKHLCLQGIMTNDHHSHAYVRLLPVGVDNLFNVSSDPKADQRSLNEVLDQPNTCTSSMAGKLSIEFVPLVFLVVMSLWCI